MKQHTYRLKRNELYTSNYLNKNDENFSIDKNFKKENIFITNVESNIYKV
jgi:hypothetical protein